MDTNLSQSPIELTPDEVRRLPPAERKPWLHRILLKYDGGDEILKEMQCCFDKQPFAAEPPCMLLEGQTGTGKSTLLNLFAERYPPVITNTGIIRPVVTVTVHAPATPKGVVIDLLDALGDPLAESGTQAMMTRRAKKLVKDCKTQLFICDEIQDYMDFDTLRVLQNVSNWLKTFIKLTHVGCVLAGLQGVAATVITSNPQLARLFRETYTLIPFRWETNKPSTIREFCDLLKQLEGMLPLNVASDLDKTDTAVRVFVACRGVLGSLMTLMRSATEIALDTGQEYLSLETLSKAFKKNFAPPRGNNGESTNPFEGDVPNPANMPALSVPSSSPGTNRRSRRRDKKPENSLESIR